MLIAEIPKNSNGEVIKVNIQTFRGKRLADCRVYYMDKAGTWKPTRKGLAVTLETVDALIEALTRAKVELLRNPSKIIAGWGHLASFLGINHQTLRSSIISGLPIRHDGRVWWAYESELLKIKDEWQART